MCEYTVDEGLSTGNGARLVVTAQNEAIMSLLCAGREQLWVGFPQEPPVGVVLLVPLGCQLPEQAGAAQHVASLHHLGLIEVLPAGDASDSGADFIQVAVILGFIPVPAVIKGAAGAVSVPEQHRDVFDLEL